MIYKYKYQTPKAFSNILMNSDGEYLTGLWFEGSRDSSKHEIDCEERDLPIFRDTIKWLDIYFSGKDPNFKPKYKIERLTPFRKEVIVTKISGSDVPIAKIVNPINISDNPNLFAILIAAFTNKSAPFIKNINPSIISNIFNINYFLLLFCI